MCWRRLGDCVCSCISCKASALVIGFLFPELAPGPNPGLAPGPDPGLRRALTPGLRRALTPGLRRALTPGLRPGLVGSHGCRLTDPGRRPGGTGSIRFHTPSFRPHLAPAPG